MVKIYACFFFLLLMIVVRAHDNFSALRSEVEQKILYSQYREALELANHERRSYPKHQQSELDVLKLECLNKLNLVDEAFALSQNILSQTHLSPKLKLRTHLQRALIYELGRNLSSCKKEVDIAEQILNRNPALKPANFTYFLIRKASYYNQAGDKQKAMQTAMDADKFAAKNKDQKNGAMLNVLLGHAWSAEPEKALRYFEKAVRLFKNHNNQGGTAGMYNIISRFYFDRSETALARKYVDSAVAKHSNIEVFHIMAESYRIRSLINERQNNYPQALKDFKTAAEFTKKDNEEQRETKVRELDLMYDFETNKLREKEMFNSMKSTRKWNSMLAICTLVLVFFTAVLLYVVRLFSRSRARIKVQNQSISEKNAALKKNVDEKEFLVRELNHRVKNNLAVILSLVGFQRDETRDVLYKNKFEQLYARINTIALAHQLFTYNVDNFDHTSVELMQYSEKIIDLHKAGSTQPLKVETEFDEVQMPVDQGLSYGLLLNELLTNSMKHAVPSDGETLKIFLKVRQNNGQAEVEYSDNGRLFTKKERKSSLGRFIIDAMIEQLRGTCSREGSYYSITFPLDGRIVI
ncbi:Sensory transduction histidine kinase [Flavobacteriaceae bacterium 3519-10]|nr:Sensory transduction histidine kinase [Flavobacteriaceae bacterium 3519-10]